MGKDTDKLYITHSEWSNEFSAGGMMFGGARTKRKPDSSFKRLPFYCCALSLQPFKKPVCTMDGHTFDKTNILEWLAKRGPVNPVTGNTLLQSDLIELKFHKADGDDVLDLSEVNDRDYGTFLLVCPITRREFTDSSHIVAIATTGNVYSWDAVRELNIAVRQWKDLVDDSTKFSRTDIITLQDPKNPRDQSSFFHIKTINNVQNENLTTLSNSNNELRSKGINSTILASRVFAELATTKFSKILPENHLKKKTEELSSSRLINDSDQRNIFSSLTSTSNSLAEKQAPFKATGISTGRAAASFTSSVMDLRTATEVVHLSANEVMYREFAEYYMAQRKIKGSHGAGNGYVQLKTNIGDLNFEIHCVMAPRTCHNFLSLCSSGYYSGILFHRSIRGFMIQGGDPTGTGKGGKSYWGEDFNDEIRPSMKHNARGLLSMANKGKNTNSSQFFITFAEAQGLDGKHTIFGKLVGGMAILDKLEAVDTDKNDKPLSDLVIIETRVFGNPFAEWYDLKSKIEAKKTRAAMSRSDLLKIEGSWLSSNSTDQKRFKSEKKSEFQEERYSDKIGKYVVTVTDNQNEEKVLEKSNKTKLSLPPPSRKI